MTVNYRSIRYDKWVVHWVIVIDWRRDWWCLNEWLSSRGTLWLTDFGGRMAGWPTGRVVYRMGDCFMNGESEIKDIRVVIVFEFGPVLEPSPPTNRHAILKWTCHPFMLLTIQMRFWLATPTFTRAVTSDSGQRMTFYAVPAKRSLRHSDFIMEAESNLKWLFYASTLNQTPRQLKQIIDFRHLDWLQRYWLLNRIVSARPTAETWTRLHRSLGIPSRLLFRFPVLNKTSS